MEVLALIPNQHGHAPGQRSSIELWESVLAPVGINIHYAPSRSALPTWFLRHQSFRDGARLHRAPKTSGRSQTFRRGLCVSRSGVVGPRVSREADRAAWRADHLPARRSFVRAVHESE